MSDALATGQEAHTRRKRWGIRCPTKVVNQLTDHDDNDNDNTNDDGRGGPDSSHYGWSVSETWFA